MGWMGREGGESGRGRGRKELRGREELERKRNGGGEGKEEGVRGRGSGGRRSGEEGRESGEGGGCKIDGALETLSPRLSACLWGSEGGNRLSGPQTSGPKKRPGTGHWELHLCDSEQRRCSVTVLK